MAAINSVNFAVSKQAFYNERATKFCGSNYQKSCKHLPVACLYKVTHFYGKKESVNEFYSVKTY